MSEPLVIDISELKKYDDVSPRSLLTFVARWYFHQLGEQKKTQHDLELFQQLVYRFKFISRSQSNDMSVVNLEKYPNKHLFEISVLLDGTETWRYVDEGNHGGIHFKDQRLVQEPEIQDHEHSYPSIGDSDFEIQRHVPYLSYFVMVFVAFFVVTFIVRKVRRVDKKRD